MNLSTEAERLDAFSAAYPGEHEILEPKAGIGNSGFRIITFDAETKYAQFKNANSGSYHGEYFEFAQSGDKTPIKRIRFYLPSDVRRPEQSLKLDSLDIEYPLGGNLLEWYFNYEGLKSSAATVYFPGPAGKVILAKCGYTYGNPVFDLIQITTGTLAEALTAHEAVESYGRWEVQLNFTMRGGKEFGHYGVFSVRRDPYDIAHYLGMIEPGQRFTHPEFPGVLTTQYLDNGTLKIVREEKEETVLELPKLDYADINRRLRGPWQDYVTFPENYPVNFQLG